MLNDTHLDGTPTIVFSSLLLLGAILLGAGLGHAWPSGSQWLGQYQDQTLLTLIGLLFFNLRLSALLQAATHLRFLAIALVANFLLIPWIGYAVASLFLAGQPLLMVGLMIYFMSPCTDWFLGFTRLSGGNIALGTALIPLNMLLQLLLYPIYLQVFTEHTVQVEAGVLATTLLQWFLLPLSLALLAHLGLRRLLRPGRFEQLLQGLDTLTPWLLALLVMQIFSGNIAVLLEHRQVFAWLLLAVFVFFVLTFILGEVLSRACRLHYPEHALLTMTLAARNAPLMLAVSIAAFPDQPLIHAALVIGMLVEFPHLMLLRRLLLGTASQAPHSPQAQS